MIELYGKRGFEYGLSYPQITLTYLDDKHHEDQATVALNSSSRKHMALTISSPLIAVMAQYATISQSYRTAFTSAAKMG